MIRTYWWNEEGNWGDRLTPILLAHFSGIKDFEWVKSPDKADLLTLGSILDLVPEDYDGIILGSGLLAKKEIKLPNAYIMGVRGPLTHMRIKAHHSRAIQYGDPGLLADELPDVQPNTRDIDLGILPHWSDKQLTRRNDWYNPAWKTIRINPRDDPKNVIRQIGRCRKLVTSSLHGLIIADAFGIPRRLEMSDFVMTRPKEGGTFKFEDYHASIKLPFVIGEVQRANRNIINERKDIVYDLYRELKNVI